MTGRGQFIPGNSLSHKLDPRVKLISNIILIVLVFTTDSFIMQGMLALPAVFLYLQAKLGFKGIRRILRTTIYIAIFIFLANMIILAPDVSDPWVDASSNNTHIPKYRWGIFILTYFSVIRALLIAIRIFTMITITSLLTASTKPMALTRAIEDMLMPLKLIKVPVHIIAMIMSIALRFIPTLMAETQRIMKAQASRGVDYKNGGLRAKAKSMITLIIPLFVSAFVKAEDLGNAMETRGYDPYEKRTRYRHYPIKLLDIVALLVMVAFIAMIALTNNSVIELPQWDNWT